MDHETEQSESELTYCPQDSGPTEVQPAPRKDTRFKPGVSGNPGGRRKNAVSLSHAIRRVLSREQAEAIASTLINAAIGGDMNAVKILADRIDGRVSSDGVNVLIQNTNDSTTTKVDFDVESYRRSFAEFFGISVQDSPEKPVHPALPDPTPGNISEPA